MKNKKNVITILLLIIIFILGCSVYLFYSKNKNTSPVENPVENPTVPINSPVVYGIYTKQSG